MYLNEKTNNNLSAHSLDGRLCEKIVEIFLAKIFQQFIF